MKFTRRFLNTATIGAVALIGACGQQEAAAPATEAAPAENESILAEQPVALPRTASAESARLFFITPADGDTLSNPVAIGFGLEGMAVVAAGVNEAHTGHHHLLVDTGLPDLGLPAALENSGRFHLGPGMVAQASREEKSLF